MNPRADLFGAGVNRHPFIQPYTYPVGMAGLQNPPSARSAPILGGDSQSQTYMEPILAAIASLTDQMKSMSEVLRDVHDISYQHSATLKDHANTIHQIAPEVKPTYGHDGMYLRHMPGSSQASTRETTPHMQSVYPGSVPAGRIASGPFQSPQMTFGIPLTQPYRIAPSPALSNTEEVARPPLPSPQSRMVDLSPKSPNLTARSSRTTVSAPRQPPNRSPSVTRSAAAAARERLIASRQAPASSVRSKSPARTVASVRNPPPSSVRSKSPAASASLRSKSPANTAGPSSSLRSKSPVASSLRSKSPARVPSNTVIPAQSMRSKSPARLPSNTVVPAQSIRSKSPSRLPSNTVAARPSTPVIRYEVQISFNERIVARAQVNPALSQDGPFLYVVQSELSPALSFIPVAESPCPFTGLSISVVGTNTRTRRSNVVFKSHDSHVDNPPVNDADGYFSHSCWLSGPSASVVGGVRVFFKTGEDDSVTLYAMSLKFWFPETGENGVADPVPNFSKDHWKELLRLLGIL